MTTENLPATQSEPTEKERLRQRALALYADQLEHAVLVARAEGSAADNIRLLAELRTSAGLDEKAKFDNIPNITVVFGSDFTQTIAVKPVATAAPADVVDVESTPILPESPPEEQPVTLVDELLNMAAQAMALPDD